MRTSARSVSVCAIGIALAAVLASGCDNNNNPSSPTPGSGSGNGTAGNPITVFITNSTYSPNPLTVKAGQFVNFKNNDSIVHSATFDNGSYESGDIPPLSAHDAPVAMTAAGTFGFHCRQHGERGTILVAP